MQGYGEELLMDHEGINYDSNFVTMYDLMLNHLKKGICGPAPRHYTRGKYSISIDTTAIYVRNYYESKSSGNMSRKQVHHFCSQA